MIDDIARRAESTAAPPLMFRILPPDVTIVETTGRSASRPLSAEEARALGDVADKRNREFSLGRQCAHRCLAEIGAPAASLLPGSQGEPIWPAGYVGSITHCSGYCAAAVASTRQVAAIGIDAEPIGPLSKRVLDEIAFDEEINWVAEQPNGSRGRLLFCAKESAYKAWFALTESWLGFEDVRVQVNQQSNSFSAQLLVPGPMVGGKPLQTLSGRFLVTADHVLTATVIRETAD